MIHVICGAPCSGKSHYVKHHAKQGEIVIDADKIAEAIGSGVKHQANGVCWDAALKLRKVLIDYAKRSDAESWIIHTKPSKSQIEEYKRLGAEIVVLDPGIEVCKQRAEERPKGTVEEIEKYYRTETTREQFAEWFGQVNET